MKLKRLNLILLSAIALSACNGGSGSLETNSNLQKESEELVPNPRIVGNSLRAKLTAGNDDPEFLDVNKGVRIGYGYDPLTRKVLSIPMNSEDFAYSLGGKDKSPFEIPSACVMVNYADELGKVSSTSNATLLNADLKGAVNVGFAKANLAASFNRETLDDSNHLSISKLFGAAVRCQVDTNVAPDLVGDKSDNYQYMQEALMKSAPGLANSITEIRSAKTLAARQAAIKSFYEKYGTYMVSGITLGEVAVRKINMTQTMNTSETKIAGAVAANYSSPFSSVEASAKYGNNSKIDTKSWELGIKEGFFPADNKLDTVINRLQTEFDNMKKEGVIDFTKLKPDPVDKPVIKTPEIPAVDLDKDLKANYAKATTNYKVIVELVDSIQSTMADIGTSKDEKILHYSLLKDDITNVIETNTELNTEQLAYLTSTNYNNYISKYATLLGKWKSYKLASICAQLITALESDNQTTIASLEAKVRAITQDADSAQGKDKAAAEEQKQKDEQAEKDKKANGITLSKYIETKFVAEYRSADTIFANKYDDAKNSADKEDVLHDWMGAKLANGEATSKAFLDKKLVWTKEWSEKYGSAPQIPLYVPKSEADQYLHANKPSAKAMLNTGNDEGLYKDKGVLDFKVTAWAKIFPELTQTFGVDDEAELNENLVMSGVKEYIKYYLYLSQMSALDGSLESMRYQEEGIYKKLNRLQSDLNDALDNAKDSVIFMGETYALDQDSRVNDLIQKINEVKSGSVMLKSEWYKASKELFNRDLIGQYGSFLGVKPEYPNKMSGFGLLTQPLNKIPTVAEMDAKAEINPYKSGVRVIFQRLSNLLLNNAKELSMKELSGVLEVKKSAKNLSVDDPEYKDNYMFDSMHNVGQLALNDVPQGTPTNLGGVMPVVLGATKFSSGVISNLGLVDSSGHIIGANAGSTNIGDSYNSATLSYNLNLNTNIGNDRNPTYELTLNQGNGLVTEVSLKGAITDQRAWYNKLLLGASLYQRGGIDSYNRNLSGDLSVCMDDQDSKNPDGGGCGRIAGSWSEIKIYKWFNGDGRRLQAYMVYSSYSGGIYANDNTKLFLQSQQTNGSLYNRDYNWGYANGLPVDYFYGVLPLYKYKLVITPINKNVISSMSNVLKVGGYRQSPFLPTYNYWGL